MKKLSQKVPLRQFRSADEFELVSGDENHLKRLRLHSTDEWFFLFIEFVSSILAWPLWGGDLLVILLTNSPKLREEILLFSSIVSTCVERLDAYLC